MVAKEDGDHVAAAIHGSSGEQDDIEMARNDGFKSVRQQACNS